MDNSEDTKTTASNDLEVSLGGSVATSGSFSTDGSVTGLKANTREGQGIEFDAKGEGLEETGLSKSAGAEDDAERGLKEEGGAEDKADSSETQEDAPEDLGDYSAETASKFDERYFVDGPDGPTLNGEAFNQELAANLAKDPANYDINSNTRAYLKDKLGISNEFIDSHLKGLQAQRVVAEEAFYNNPEVGGKALYETKLAWGKENYTDDQKAKFNKALAAGGSEALEAIELLNARFTKGGGKAPAAGAAPKNAGVGRPERREASPQRDVTQKATAGVGVRFEPFADANEHRKALAASKSERDREIVRARLKASPWWNKQ